MKTSIEVSPPMLNTTLYLFEANDCIIIERLPSQDIGKKMESPGSASHSLSL